MASSVDFSAEVNRILAEYGEEVNERMGEVVNQLAAKAVKELKAKSPVKKGAPKSGSYAKGWKVDKDKARARGLLHSATVYNSQPGLPHLLEHGHALRQGGRWEPKTEHIKPVDDALADLFRPEDLLP